MKLPPHQDPENRQGSIDTVQFTSYQAQRDWLLRRVEYLEHELAGAEDRYKQLEQIYTKLADQWNAFQAQLKPTQRNVHRAEASGELCRRLAGVLIGLAYETAGLDDLIDTLQALRVPPERRLK